MQGLMQEIPLMISSLIRYAAEYHGDRQVVSRTVEGPIHRYGYAECERRARRVANVMARLGIGHGDRVGTLAWNGYRHLELFYGVSGMGAVLHTVNPRLFTEQIVYIINHAEDRVLFVDLTFVELVERIADQLTTVEHVVVMTDEEHMPASALPNVLCYETLLAGESEDYAWPLFDERAASSLCYTSGTTGNPKGVLYSHRSTLLHAMAACQNSAMGISAHDVIMPIAPMYHGNAWSLPYLGCLTGSGMVLPGTKLDGQSLQELIEGEGVTFALGVPTVFTMLIDHLDETGKKVDSLERVAIGGSAVPRSMIERLADPYGVTVHQLWGMTETSPLGTLATATPAIDALSAEERQAVLSQQGRVQFGLELKITGEDGGSVPRDGKTFGACGCAATGRPAATSRARAATGSTRTAGSPPAMSPPSMSTCGCAATGRPAATSRARAATGSRWRSGGCPTTWCWSTSAADRHRQGAEIAPARDVSSPSDVRGDAPADGFQALLDDGSARFADIVSIRYLSSSTASGRSSRSNERREAGVISAVRLAASATTVGPARVAISSRTTARPPEHAFLLFALERRRWGTLGA